MHVQGRWHCTLALRQRPGRDVEGCAAEAHTPAVGQLHGPSVHLRQRVLDDATPAAVQAAPAEGGDERAVQLRPAREPGHTCGAVDTYVRVPRLRQEERAALQIAAAGVVVDEEVRAELAAR